MLTTTEAAQLLGVERRTVNQYIRRKQLAAEKHGRDLFISQDEIDRFKVERPRAGWPKGKPRKAAGPTGERIDGWESLTGL